MSDKDRIPAEVFILFKLEGLKTALSDSPKVLQQFCHIQRQMDDPVFDHDVFGIENICIANNG